MDIVLASSEIMEPKPKFLPLFFLAYAFGLALVLSGCGQGDSPRKRNYDARPTSSALRPPDDENSTTNKDSSPKSLPDGITEPKTLPSGLVPEEVKISVDPETKKIELQGRINLIDPNSKKGQELNIKLEGKFNKLGLGKLKALAEDPNIKVKSFVTCLDESNGDCKSPIADIFVYNVETKKFQRVQLKGFEPPPEPAQVVPNIPEPTEASSKPEEETENKTESYDPKEEGQADEYVAHSNLKAEQVFPELKDNPPPETPQAQTEPNIPPRQDPQTQENPPNTALEEVLSEDFNIEGSEGKIKYMKALGLDPRRPFDQVRGYPSETVGRGIGGSLREASSMIDVFRQIKRDRDPKGLPLLFDFTPGAKSRSLPYGSWETVSLVRRLAEIHEKFKLPQTFLVSDLSARLGGPLYRWVRKPIRDKKTGKMKMMNVREGHLSHQNGLDVDIIYPSKKPFSGEFTYVMADKHGALNSHFDAGATYALFEEILRTSSSHIDRFLVGYAIKRALCKKAVALGRIDSDFKAGPGQELLRRVRAVDGHNDHFHLRLKCSAYHPKCGRVSEPDHNLGCRPE